ncbi:MAG: HAMP domain-containing sensor histidine kinase [Peptostreptococcaceae bacterium]|nr:HAMP domain-containing sensor histidine kinase [Peptostreptococcaceae bacterium]MDY5739786.1 HAMP domain-containing sensor histidine kinase [Anaerovoracaceae bacterium]
MKIISRITNMRKTIVFKLILAVIVIFLAMISILYISINYYQSYAMERLLERMQLDLNNVEATKEDALLIFRSDEIPSRTEFLIYTAIISLGVTGIGIITFYIVIRGVMKPLKQLTEKVSIMDIEKASYEKNEFLMETGDLEVQKLAKTLDRAFSEIYDGYERQKKFSINVAHEVRTPLAILSARIDVFKKKRLGGDGEIDSFANSIQDNIIRLSEMVESIMLLSTNRELQKREVCLNEIFDEIFFDLEDMALQNNVRLIIKGDDVVLNTDDQILERGLFNIIENGIKYNEYGGCVEVNVKAEEDTVRIKISDTGVGICDEDKLRIFDLFYRVDESRNRGTGGCGIGLALVMHIVGRLGGTVSVKDNIPKGSIFEIILPIK